MHLSGSQVIAILCITTANSSAFEVLTEVQQRNFISNNNSNNNSNTNNNDNNRITSYELNVLNDFLDYNLLHRVIIIYTSSTSRLNTTIAQGYQRNGHKDKFLKSSLIQKLSATYHIQFVNTLWPNSFDYLLHSYTSRVGVFMKYDAGNKGKEMILNLMSLREKFSKSLKWLLLMEDIKDPLISLQNAFGDLNILIDAEITVAIKSCNFTFDLYDVYKICHTCGSPLEIVYKGNWTLSKGLAILKKFHYGIAVRRNNFKMFKVKATTVILNKSPALKMTDLEYLKNDKDFLDRDAMQRKTYQLLQLMENLFNMSFDITFTNSWGVLENGSWTGAMGLLTNHQVEFTLCPLRYLLPRREVLQFSTNIHREKIHFIFRHPKRTSIRNIFFEPLADMVWWCVLALIVVTILLLAVHVHAEYKIFTKLQKQTPMDGNPISNGQQQQQQQQHQQQPPVENHFDFIVLCIMEAILMQGPAPELFRCNSTRLLVVSVSIFSILLMQFYGAFIVSSLLSEAPRTITNLKALYNSSLEMGMENVSYNYDVFINNKNPLVRDLYQHRICNRHTNQPNVMTLEEGAKKIGKGNFAFHVAIDRVYRLLTTFLTESQFCDLQEINFHPSFTFTSGIGIRKSTPYYEFITLAIAMFQEAALLKYNNKKWEVNKIDCSSIQSEEVEVDLEHFAPALAFLFFSILISLLALIVEIVYEQVRRRMEL